MLKTMLWISFFTICICWVIGAYNRLVRMRAAALAKDANALSIALYNFALQQFPALLIVPIFAFKPITNNENKNT